jgi:glycosyltransferase 2 family protein
VKLAINLALSLVMLAVCLWLVWPSSAAAPGHKSEMQLIEETFQALQWSEFWPYLAAYLGLMLVQHLCRSLRWNYLLAPLGIHVPPGPLLAISSVGFMAILALPLRLGELVRPGLLRRRGISASAALGTVAVERIVDGLMISLFVFVALFMRRGPDAPDWMMPTAFGALGIFTAALVFLLFAMKWPEKTVRFSLKMSLLPRFAPKIAKVIEEKLHEMIRGFAVLRDVPNMIKFTLWTAVYWSANGLTVWVLAKGFQTISVNFELSVTASFAVMGLVGVGISLPNAPGLVGQFQAFTLLGLSVYLGPAVLEHGDLYPVAIAYAILHHLLQVIWYVGVGALGLASPWVSISDLRQARAKPVDEKP